MAIPKLMFALVTIVIYVALSDGSASSLNRCESITVPICKGLPYNITSFRIPNYFNHRTQAEAGLEVHQFFPLIKVQCSDYLQFFLCSLYVPPCQAVGNMGNIPPCRSVCKKARNGCSKLMKRFDFFWPDSMHCSKFPKDDGQVLCLKMPNRKPAPMTTVGKKGVRTNSRPPLKVKTARPACKNLVLNRCSSFNYTSIKLPNLFGHSNQYQVKRAMRRWSPILRTGCSSSLNEFLCRVYAPPCQMSRLPCRSMCKRIKKECRKTLKRLKLKWPSTLRCRILPKKRCFNGATKTTAKPTHRRRGPSRKTTTPQQTTGSGSSLNRCEKITIPICKGLPYNLTSFPNHFSNRNQQEAALFIHTLFPLIEVQCSDYLKFFLCSMHFPRCQQVGNMGINILPCRSVCEEARNGCSKIMNMFDFNWPDSMDCSKFPKDDGQVLCMKIPNRKPGTTPVVPSTPFPTTVVPGTKTPFPTTVVPGTKTPPS